jgi:hypothetical protein
MRDASWSSLRIDGRAPVDIGLRHVSCECVGAARANEALPGVGGASAARDLRVFPGVPSSAWRSSTGVTGTSPRHGISWGAAQSLPRETAELREMADRLERRVLTVPDRAELQPDLDLPAWAVASIAPRPTRYSATHPKGPRT